MKTIANAASVRLDRRMVLGGAAAVAAGAFGLAVTSRPAFAAEPAEVVEGGGGTKTVDIDKMAYSEKETKIKVGESVTWTNKDGMAHNVHLRQGPAKGKPYAQGKMLNTGDSYTLKFNEAGEYSYVCTPHPMMKAKVIVEA